MQRLKKLIGKNIFLNTVLFLGACAYCDGGAPLVDPQNALNEWLKSHDQANLDICQSMANAQIFQASNLNLGTAANSQDSVLQMVGTEALLTCLYGEDLLSQAECLNQSAGSCQAVTLLIPTSAQIKTAAAALNQVALVGQPTSVAESFY
jgi:hypothetical protein